MTNHEKTRAVSKDDLRDIWVRLWYAACQDRGLRLSADDVALIAKEHAVYGAAESYFEERGEYARAESLRRNPKIQYIEEAPRG